MHLHLLLPSPVHSVNTEYFPTPSRPRPGLSSRLKETYPAPSCPCPCPGPSSHLKETYPAPSCPCPCPGPSSRLKETYQAPSRPCSGPYSRLKETYVSPSRPCPGPSRLGPGPGPSRPGPGPSSRLYETSTGLSRRPKEASPGPAHRLKETSPVPHKLHMFLDSEVPLAPPSWMLLGNQQTAFMTQTPPPAPIVSGADASGLIPGIVCLTTQNSTVTDATVDALDELDTVGDSPEY
ncbi:hypothetical protein P692DRAFT_20877348 [Suillus brevipes Sb2]|nr:hypothetical protein P692DRAFT_20877348 [Suillus brevipes Sb2]